MHEYHIITFAASIIYLQIAVYFLVLKTKNRVNILFIVNCLLFGLYAFSQFVLQKQMNLGGVYQTDMLGMLALASSAIIFNGIFYFLQKDRSILLRNGILFILMPLMIITLIMYQQNIDQLKFYFQANSLWLFIYNYNAPVSLLILLYVSLSGAMAFIQVYRWDLSSVTNREQLQVRSVLVAITFFSIIGLLIDFVWPLLSWHVFPPIAHIAALPIFGGMFHALTSKTKTVFSEQTLSDIVTKYVKQFVVYVNAKGYLIGANHHFFQTFGYSLMEIQGKSISWLIIDLENQNNQNELFGFQSNHIKQGDIMLFRPKRGTAIPVKLNYLKTYDKLGRITGLAISGDDLREQRWLEERLETCRKNLHEQEMLFGQQSEMLSRRQKEADMAQKLLHNDLQQFGAWKKEGKGVPDSAMEELIREMHHRVKNNMQIAASLIAFTSDDPSLDDKGLKAFRSIAFRIDRMANIHEKLYATTNISVINFSEYLRELSGYLQGTTGQQHIVPEIKLEVENAYIPLSQAIICGMVAEELIENAIRHAFPPRIYSSETDAILANIWIAFYKEQESCKLVIRDNGIGLVEKSDALSQEGRGLAYVKLLVTDYLRGDFSLSSSLGTVAEVSFNTNTPDFLR